jgi:hypothetical protein
MMFRRVCKIKKNYYSTVVICLTIRIEQLGCQWTDFHAIWYEYVSKIYPDSLGLIKIWKE